jgi:hypothetical protein
MATVTGSGALAAKFTMIPITGFVYYQEGQLDSQTGTVKATGRSRWSILTSWASFNNYITTLDPIKWTAPVLDIGKVDSFNITITADFDGAISYLVHVSETGLFNGEETEYYIAEGDTNISAFYGRYVYITAICTGAEFRRMSVTSDTSKSTFKIVDVDTSTLAGTITARQIPLSVSVSKIYDLNIEPHAATSYAVNLYVSDTATSKVLIPVIVSKSAAAPSFALYGIDNDPRDGRVDLTITALPRMVMTGGNIIVVA